MSRAFTQTLFTPYLHLIGVKTAKNGAQKPKTRLSAASIFQKEKSLKRLYNKGFKDSPWTGISSSKIWTATSQALEVGSTPIARSSENIAPSKRWCFFCVIYVLPLSYLFQFLPILRPFIGRDTNQRECLIGRHPRHKDESTEDGEALFPLPLSSSFFSLLCKTNRVAHITRLLFCGRFDRMILPVGSPSFSKTHASSYPRTSIWHARIALSAVVWLSGVTPAQQAASTLMRFSG